MAKIYNQLYPKSSYVLDNKLLNKQSKKHSLNNP